MEAHRGAVTGPEKDRGWASELGTDPGSTSREHIRPLYRPTPAANRGATGPMAAGAADSEVGEEPLPRHTHVQAGRETEAQRGKP